MRIRLHGSIHFRQNYNYLLGPLSQRGMPTQNQTFYQYEAYADALQHASLRATFLGRKYANWALNHLSINNLSVQWGHTGGPGAVEGAVHPGGSVILMPTHNAHVMRANGLRFGDYSLMVMRPGGEFCLSATNFNRWINMFVPDELLAGFNGTALADIGPSCSLIRVPLDKAEKFRSAVEELGLIVQRQPGAFDSSAAMKTTARKLVGLVREVFRGQLDETPPPGRYSLRHLCHQWTPVFGASPSCGLAGLKLCAIMFFVP